MSFGFAFAFGLRRQVPFFQFFFRGFGFFFFLLRLFFGFFLCLRGFRRSALVVVLQYVVSGFSRTRSPNPKSAIPNP